ncbi:Mis6-domain-containing protein [Aulographum hederae CBS 113979]|uniref:Mis6-domain-containing protein n=1 Tax=Aulographum hederae CBS 113979 TaxID=1176131 RepID=A0A6G1HAA9_9PEZI|nr:Mis6-domain-containing protein [Aulographum hederae CBS 113979]
MTTMAELDDAPRTLEESIEALVLASQTPAKQRQQKPSVFVDAVCGHAYQVGLDHDSFEAIITLVTTKSQLDQTSITNLIKNLYPAEKVSSSHALSVVGALGQGKSKPSASTQVALVKWLHMIYELLEEPTVLSRVYGVLFGLLDMISIRAPMCHLLGVITRRKHVKPFRIQQLLELCRMVGHEPATIGLLRIFKDFYPDIILGSIGVGRGFFPRHPNPEWRERALAVQEANAQRFESNAPQQSGFKVARNTAGRHSLLPEVHTIHTSDSTITLEEINNADDFINNLERIEPPSQLISAFSDPLLRKYLALRPSNVDTRRIDLWTERFLEDELEAAKDGYPPTAEFPSLLRGLLDYTRSTKTLMPNVERFFTEYLHDWDGSSNLTEILNLLSFVPIQPFSVLFVNILKPLEQATISQDTSHFQALLQFYANLSYQWSIVASVDAVHGEPQESAKQAYHELSEHVATLALSALASDASRFSHAVLEYLEILSSLPHESSPLGLWSVPVVIPRPQVVYLLAFGSSLADLSRLCGSLASSKNAFEQSMRKSQKYPSALTSRFNGYLMDICNMLWRLQALSKSDQNAMGCLSPPALTEALQQWLLALDRSYHTTLLFGLSHNYSTSALSIQVFRDLEDRAEEAGHDIRIRHGGPVTQRTLAALPKEGGLSMNWKQYRLEVLLWLDSKGVGGIKDLMFATMKDLMRQ